MSLLRRILAYGCKTFSLFHILEHIQDRRTKPIIPTWNIVYPTFIGADGLKVYQYGRNEVYHPYERSEYLLKTGIVIL